MPEKPVRVRYAPSPTGYPHVGNIRTALFNWLYARHNKGSFIVRIEDTDTARTVDGAVEVIMDSLKWLGMDWDEGPDKPGKYGPYRQSERLEYYQKAAEKLLAQGDAYYCYCSSGRLEEMRSAQIARKEPPGYDRKCRDLSAEERAFARASCPRPVIRFKAPLEGSTSFCDVIRGEVSFENRTIDDFILLKADGYPTYHLASVVDDNAMDISHVMRAEEWISSTPKHVLLYRALGFNAPQFAHLPMILGPDRSKLSKRHGAVSITQYRDDGYLPEAMVNFLALLGWSLDDKTDIINIQTLVENFTLERIGKTAAVFNREKLEWMNGIYIRSLEVSELAKLAMPFLEQELPASVSRPVDEEYVKKVIPLVQERAKTIKEIPSLVYFFFTPDIEYPAELLIGKKMDVKTTLNALEKTLDILKESEEFDHDSLEHRLRPLAEELGLKAGQLFGAVRVAVTGVTVSPPLFETMMVMGRQACLERLEKAVEKLNCPEK
ncbi:MAG: glutamate--tRNA ligase [Dehalococcoidales bacterium]|jgi:glutamyl-tRNA synthetase|nr:glutamate--tRNA ligase [Dehalococcoidales bacterium]MDX9802616.1 glutamate--tRNA ligase [Dehalococcoidales bacterium]